MSSDAALGAIIVAAGSSSRLGRPKQLVEVEGIPLLKKVLNAVRSNSSIGPIAIIVGANAARIRSRIEEFDTVNDVHWVINPDWQQGMGSSIATGMCFLAKSFADIQGVLVSVCDQPNLNQKIIDNLSRSFHENPDTIIASRYGGITGPPVLLPPAYFDSLKQLSGPSGAKGIIGDADNRVIPVDFPGGELDIDTTEDLDKLNL